MTPEEKLLRAIFGEKASDVRDTPALTARCVWYDRGRSCFQPPWVDKDERAWRSNARKLKRCAKDRDDERAIIERNFYRV